MVYLFLLCISLNKKSLNIGQPAAAPPEPISPEPMPEPQEPLHELFMLLPVYDDCKVKYSLNLCVNEYFHLPVFGTQVKHLQCDPNVLTIANLQKLLAKLDACINSSVGLNFTAETFYFGMGIGESIIKSHTNWKVNGLTAALCTNQELTSCLLTTSVFLLSVIFK